jgi:NAD(P)-dependent dehydrogenase (short-subunit alcohol dehydrogenase family)
MDPAKTLSPASLFSAQGLTIVITGGATGIGLSFLSASVQTGASKVFILGRRLDVLQKAAEQVDPSGKIVVSVQCDVTSTKDVEAVVEKVTKEIGKVDVLVNNAGVGGPDHKAVYTANTIEEVSKTFLDAESAWTQAFAINAFAPVRVAAAFLPLLQAGNVARGWASGKMQGSSALRNRTKAAGIDESDLRTSQIITVASIAGQNRIMTVGMPYAGSKAAVLAEMKVMANFLGPWGIRCNVICPGSKFGESHIIS